MKLINNLYHYIWTGKDNNCNSYLIANVLENSGHVLIDPGHIQTPQLKEKALERLFSSIMNDGLDPNDIGLILLTHFHPDHCEAGIALQQHLSLLLGIHEKEAPYITKYGGQVDILLKEGELELGVLNTLSVDVIHTPGHSPGHVTFYIPSMKVLVAGDLVFYRSTGRVDLPGGSKEEMKSSIDRVAKLDVEYLLCGHPYGNPGVIKGSDEVKENFRAIQSLF